ncbi:MAG: glycoside hydrolase family protein [Terracidiphilus sp.]
MERFVAKTHYVSVLFLLAASLAASSCNGIVSNAVPGSGGTPTPTPTPGASKSAKRGIAYDLADPADFAALSPGVSWWYNWSPTPNASAPANYASTYQMEFYPMLWNGNFNASAVIAYLKANPSIKYILVMNEPNIVSQSNLTPQQAAQIWPQYEAVAAQTGVQIVGPAMTWGTMTSYENPVTWLDAFYAAYESANGNKLPQVDYLAFHWYDYGLAAQLDALDKYGKSIWVTEFANWHSQDDGSQIDTLALQEAQMTDMVATCEGRSDVFRYAWFTGRLSPDPHFTSLLGASGQLTGLGTTYLSLPVSQSTQ